MGICTSVLPVKLVTIVETLVNCIGFSVLTQRAVSPKTSCSRPSSVGV